MRALKPRTGRPCEALVFHMRWRSKGRPLRAGLTRREPHPLDATLARERLHTRPGRAPGRGTVSSRYRSEEVIVTPKRKRLDLPPPVQDLVQSMAEQSAIEAVTLTGSRTTGFATPDSDTDLFVYVRDEAALDLTRVQLAGGHADGKRLVVIGQPGFPNNDIWRLRDAGWIDIIWWTCEWARDELDRRLVECLAQAGYTTCFWRSIRDGIPLFERSQWHRDLQTRARVPYPEVLRRRIVDLNGALLGDENPFSYLNQMRKAVREQDSVARQHRTAAWLASYFDLVFAGNRVLHPGEKRLIAFAERECACLPPSLSSDVRELVMQAGGHTGDLVGVAEVMLDRLRASGLQDTTNRG